MQEITNYLPLNRRLFQHHFWCEEREYSRFEAWLDLLQSARFEDTKMCIGNKTIVVGRGQNLTSFRFLEQRWGWSTKRIRGFLKLLQQDQMIHKETHKETGQTLVTITNYDRYNFKRREEDTPQDTAGAQPRHSPDTKYNKDNKELKKNNSISSIIQLKKETKKTKTPTVEENQQKPLPFTRQEFREALRTHGASDQHIEDWFSVRDQKKAPYTRTALQAMLAECRKHNYPVALAVQHCAENNWRGFRVEWTKPQKPKNYENNHPHTPEAPAAALIRKRVG